MRFNVFLFRVNVVLAIFALLLLFMNVVKADNDNDNQCEYLADSLHYLDKQITQMQVDWNQLVSVRNGYYNEGRVKIEDTTPLAGYDTNNPDFQRINNQYQRLTSNLTSTIDNYNMRLKIYEAYCK